MDVHYCRSKSHRQYLHSNLNINKMYNMYTNETTVPELQVKASYFRNIFNRNFNIGFKLPAKDVCSTCLSLREQIKHEKEISKKKDRMNELTVHKRRAKSKQNVFLYTWTEDEFSKGSNQIASAVYNCLNTVDLVDKTTIIQQMDVEARIKTL